MESPPLNGLCFSFLLSIRFRPLLLLLLLKMKFFAYLNEFNRILTSYLRSSAGVCFQHKIIVVRRTWLQDLVKKKEVQCQEWECLRWNVYTTRAEICLRFASYDANPSTDLWQCPIFTAIALVANIWNGPKCSFVQHFHPMIDSFGHSNRNTKDYFFSSFALNDVEKLRFFYETAVIC